MMKKPVMNPNTHYTLILGAEGELGKALAREVARKKCNLILVSTTPVDLQRFAIGLQLKEDVQVDAVKLNLGKQERIQDFVNRLRNKYEIRALINNVSCDWSQAHRRCVSELDSKDVDTRFRGAAQLTMGLIPQMKSYPFSYIQHIIPFPFRKNQFDDEMQLSVSKMYAFAKELEEELKDTGVALSMVHPAPVKSLVPELEVFDGLSEELKTLTPKLIAMKAIQGMLRGDRLIIPGFRNKVYYFLSRQANKVFKAAEESLGSGLQPSV